MTIDVEALRKELRLAELEERDARAAAAEAGARTERAAARLGLLQDLVRLGDLYARNETPDPIPL